MYRKRCLHCGKYSYRKSNQTKWLCPFCHCDLTEVPGEFFEDKSKFKKGYFKKLK